MNELLEQFLIECRELVEAATADLLALEASPEDKSPVDGAFRGFHTLKGAAGIVDFPAMGRVVHAAEDILAAVRSGERGVSGALIGDCLACLDQVARWLDDIEAEGDIPAAPDAAADALLTRLTVVGRPAAVTPDAATPASDPPAGPPGQPPEWVTALLARHPAVRDSARVAVRYEPDADCFFRGDDPLALVASLPDLLALEAAPRQPWAALEELDPFECNLTILVVTAATQETVLAALKPAAGQYEIWPLAGADDAQTPRLSPDARAVLEEQALLAANTEPSGFAGRLGSAGQVAANVLDQAGWPSAARAITEAVSRGQREGHAEAFIATLRSLPGQWLPDPSPAAPHDQGDQGSGSDATAAEATPAAPTPLTPQSDTDPIARAQNARSLRVDVERIDALVSLTGELTVAKNAIGHTARLAQGGMRESTDAVRLATALKDQHALLERLVQELQRSVLAVRVLPLRHVFQHFPRLVREMARALGKSVRLVIEGEQTEADKSTVEALFEPLLHVLRNALDHGVEPEAARVAAGKPPGATVSLRAARDGDQVIVDVTDDGRGIDTGAVRRIALQRGIATEAALGAMGDAAVTDLIFSPGFSTAEAVTGLSGRGVGMDAVRAAAARLGGRVTVASRPGAGTSVRFTLPFTVIMQRVMTVEAGGQTFGVPIEAVIETTRVKRENITRIGATQAIVARDRALPLLRLTDLLDLPSEPGNAGPADADARVVIVSLAGANAEPQIGALEVENFGERMDVMLKPMDGLLAGAGGFAGTTLLGDGRVLIVLDLGELLR